MKRNYLPVPILQGPCMPIKEGFQGLFLNRPLVESPHLALLMQALVKKSDHIKNIASSLNYWHHSQPFL